jgi:phage recombination protein Bet
MNAHVPALIKEVEFKGDALRLPYVEGLDAFGIDNVGWKVLTDTVFPAAKSLDAVIMALTYCRRRNLDPFKRVVHIVPMWSSEKRAMVETVWPAIAELRTTAFRTGQYAGCDEAEFGDEVEETFEDTFQPREGSRGRAETRTETVVFPEWCRITTYRILHGQRCKFVGPKVSWLEAYGRWKNTAVPNDMWCKRPIGQLEKCAEAASLRRAFPEEIGNELTAEEMEGRSLDSAQVGYDIPTRTDTRRAPAPNKPAEPKQIEAQAAETVDTLNQDESEREPVPVSEQGEPQPDRRRAPAPNTKPAEPQKMDVIGIAMQRGYEARKGSNIRRGAVPGEYRDAARKDEASAWQDGWDKADAEKANVGLFNPEATRKAFIDALSAAKCAEDAEEAWKKLIYPHEEEIAKPDLNEFDAMYIKKKGEFEN